MKTLMALALVLAGFPPSGAAQNDEFRIKGVAVYGLDNELAVPVISDSLHRFITIQFDVAAPHPPPLRIHFLHCDRDWVPEDNAFIQDARYNTSSILHYQGSPGGIRGYDYRFVNRFPDSGGVVQFPWSGNWVFQIIGDDGGVLGEGRFFVIERLVRPSVSVKNAYQPQRNAPLNQVHRIDVRMTLPDEMEGMFYTAVDVYQNRRFTSPFRIDALDSDPQTTVEGFGSGERTFSLLNAPPGNEYRTLDISNQNRYPARDTVRPIDGLDLPRVFWRTGIDHDGTALLNRFGGILSEYLPVMFRLKLPPSDPAARGTPGVFVVGPFNAWEPGPEDMLRTNAREGALVSVRELRRGLYDYQYVTGTWNEAERKVTGQDWLVLEGNDWRTTNTYMACVYYRDERYGGFDRLAGFGIARSSGGGEAGE